MVAAGCSLLAGNIDSVTLMRGSCSARNSGYGKPAGEIKVPVYLPRGDQGGGAVGGGKGNGSWD